MLSLKTEAKQSKYKWNVNVIGMEYSAFSAHLLTFNVVLSFFPLITRPHFYMKSKAQHGNHMKTRQCEMKLTWSKMVALFYYPDVKCCLAKLSIVSQLCLATKNVCRHSVFRKSKAIHEKHKHRISMVDRIEWTELCLERCWFTIRFA